MMSMSAEPSLVDQHSAVACSPAEPLWNQASASLSEKIDSILVSSSPKLTGCSILYLHQECWNPEVSDLPAARAWSRGSATATRIERLPTNHTPDVDHGQPQLHLRVVFYFSVFLSPFVFSPCQTKAGTTTTSWMRRIGGRLKILQEGN